jgi:fucose permease
LPSSPIPAITVTIAISALFFIYVGTETSIGGWAAELAKRIAGHASNLSTVAPMFFYAGLMIGRALAPLVLLRIRESRVALAGLLIVTIGIGVVIAATSQRPAIAGLAIAGFGCASVYPIYISWFSKWYRAAARRLGGVVFSLASLGGAALPWLVGFLSKQSGSLRIGLLIPFFSALLMICILLLLRRRTVR